ncbi:MAG: HEAT repeat domain-containing protein, partial [Candidatus Kariarchaeaceae archaeon]
MSIDDLLIQLRDEPDLQIRRYIPDKLAKLGNWKSTEPLGNLIIDSLQPVVMRNEAVESLGKQGDPRAIPYLAQVLDDSEDDIRRTSVWSLGQIGTPETIPYIFSRIDDTWVETRRWVAKAAGRVRSPEVIDPLLQYYRTIDPVKDQRVFADIVRAFRSQIHYLSDQQLSQLTRSFETLLTEDLQGSVLQALILFLLDAYRLGITPSRDILHKVYQTRNQNDPLVRPHLIIGLG